jgi:hypothetical protein
MKKSLDKEIKNVIYSILSLKGAAGLVLPDLFGFFLKKTSNNE